MHQDPERHAEYIRLMADLFVLAFQTDTTRVATLAVGSDEAMFRRYNRWHSRFDQPDPYDGSYDATDPQSFNRYAYTQNDPVNFVDPSGLMPGFCFLLYTGDGHYASVCFPESPDLPGGFHGDPNPGPARRGTGRR